MKQSGEFGIGCLLGESASLLEGPTLTEDAIVVHGDRGRFSSFLEIPQLQNASTMLDAWDGTPGMARAWSPVETKRPFEMYPTRGQVRTLYDAGFTIVLEAVERYVPALRPLCRRLESDLGVPVGKVYVEAFCALAGARARAHFDPSITFNCQVDGTKTWWLAKNEAVRHPPVGMFLGRPLPPELEGMVAGAIPDSMPADSERIVAEPGTVVFLPPGVLHATETETASFAVLFALEADTVADVAASRVRKRLAAIEELRAPRVHTSAQVLEHEARAVAAQLRKIANELDGGDLVLPTEGDRVRLRPGLTAEPRGERRTALRSATKERVVDTDPGMARILHWASGRDAFSLRDLTRDHGTLDATDASQWIDQLVHAGLVERLG